ncbi:MAG: hypothetical protein ABIO70_16315, partial [Pseudomonadota bacterium]
MTTAGAVEGPAIPPPVGRAPLRQVSTSHSPQERAFPMASLRIFRAGELLCESRLGPGRFIV